MDAHKTFSFLDDPAEILGVPVDQALAAIVPVGIGSAMAHMGTGLLVGMLVFVIYRKISSSSGFSLAGKMMQYGIKPPGCLPTPAAITYYHGS